MSNLFLSEHGTKVEKLFTLNMYQFWDLELVYLNAIAITHRGVLFYGYEGGRLILFRTQTQAEGTLRYRNNQIMISF